MAKLNSPSGPGLASFMYGGTGTWDNGGASQRDCLQIAKLRRKLCYHLPGSSPPVPETWLESAILVAVREGYRMFNTVRSILVAGYDLLSLIIDLISNV
ncbi:uncharacterized protein CDV56_106375 [Aspergillus thermomutatus]|uniref:Uncharacterized protein n=1 Tax=Aspergillus thermomutatus TaxID=41047 RepID=A0A397HFS4_ASPTH|nr:uncharacterized protein CDV56_106375 [Aspergillus thermomutatus]RHZ62001.1 hypothetical protein CDV56_106375 [Aspergillus thermomutatus]